MRAVSSTACRWRGRFITNTNHCHFYSQRRGVGGGSSASRTPSVLSGVLSRFLYGNDMMDSPLNFTHRERDIAAAPSPPQTHPSASPAPSCRGAASYHFPVGRAMRYVSEGQRYFHRNDGLEEIQKLLERCNVPPPPLSRDRNDAAQWASIVQEDTSFSSLAGRGGVGRRVSATLDDFQRFINYHCHQVRAGFKKDRKKWSAKRQSKTNGKCSVSGLSNTDIGALMDYLFQTSVLLHLTALYGVGDKYLESLLDISLSASIFLSQSLNERRHRHPRGPNAVTLDSLPSVHWHSLMWAIIHYCESVRLWGLLDHTTPLWDMERTRKPTARLLQAHVGILLQLVTTSGAQLGHKELIHLKSIQSGAKHQERLRTIDTWFGETIRVDSVCDGRHDSLNTIRMQYAQQRTLQLLPMLWLSVLCTHINHSGTAPSGEAVDHPDITWRSARYAFLKLLPLFSKHAKADVTLWVMARLLYVEQRVLPNQVDLALVLSHMERNHISAVAQQHPRQEPRHHQLLRQWWRMAAAVSDSREFAPPVIITSPKVLYVAFMNIPISVLALCASQQRSALGEANAIGENNGQRFVCTLLYRILMQWRYEELFPAQIEDAQRAVLKHVEELVLLLGAAQHLREIHQQAAALEGDAVRDAVEAVVRALCEQLGKVVLPRRDRMQHVHSIPLMDIEKEVLHALYCVVMATLVGEQGAAQGEEGSSDATFLGKVPRSYVQWMEKLRITNSQEFL